MLPPGRSTRLPEFRPPDDRGATAVEYALMVLFIAAVLITVVGLLGLDVRDAFVPVEAGIDGTPNG